MPLLGWLRPQAVKENMKYGGEIDFIALSSKALMKINGHFIHKLFPLLVGES